MGGSGWQSRAIAAVAAGILVVPGPPQPADASPADAGARVTTEGAAVRVTTEGAAARASTGSAAARVREVARAWTAAVADRAPELPTLVSRDGRAYYARLQQVALTATATELDRLEIIDRLQALFLRLMLPPEKLQAMSGAALLRFAVAERFIGQDLRRADELREIEIRGDRASGRLYKFGRDDRPDRGRQFFVREAGEWKVSLRGELERLRHDFDAFVARSGLAPAEAAFFILETRLMRKVVPADFRLPNEGSGRGGSGSPSTPSGGMTLESFRLVAIRRSLDDPALDAVVLEDRREAVHHVVGRGEMIPGFGNAEVVGIETDAIRVRTAGGMRVLRLDVEGPALDERPRVASRRGAHVAPLLAQAALGRGREGMMTQWRNVGLRGRPQLLQQGALVPHRIDGAMRGLRVRRVTEASFWDQIGLRPGDLLLEFGGRPIRSDAAWSEAIQIAQSATELAVRVERDGRRLRFETRTIRPTRDRAGLVRVPGAGETLARR